MKAGRETITITFGECAENHVGMQQLGHIAESGIQVSELQDFRIFFEERGFKCQLVNLNAKLPIEIEAEQAAVLIVRNGVRAFGLDPNVMFEKLKALHWDSTMYSAKHGGKVNKIARHNICISAKSQKADIENKKGTVYAYDDLPDVKFMKEILEEFFENRYSLYAEGNRYYDVTKCGISFHGDNVFNDHPPKILR